MAKELKPRPARTLGDTLVVLGAIISALSAVGGIIIARRYRDSDPKTSIELSQEICERGPEETLAWIEQMRRWNDERRMRSLIEAYSTKRISGKLLEPRSQDKTKDIKNKNLELPINKNIPMSRNVQKSS
jgi:hypothetical protein